MDVFIQRLKRMPRLSAQLIIATLLSNILALASPLFVMQVLNRYVSQGVDSTLATLTFGTLAAVVMEFIFRQMRHRMAEQLNGKPNEEIRLAGFSVLTHGKIPALEQIPAAQRRATVSAATDVEQVYNASNLNVILDLPFSVIFLFILLISAVATFVLLSSVMFKISQHMFISI